MTSSSASLAPSWGQFVRDTVSPDGRWRVSYDADGGERSPLIESPRVIEVATQRVWLDLWRSGLDGTVTDFSRHGFRLRVSDPYYPLAASLWVETSNETFFLENPVTPAQPADRLSTFVRSLMEHARADWTRRNTPPPLPASARRD